MRRAAALPIATVDCFQKNGEVVYRSGNVFARPDCVWNRSDDAGWRAYPPKTFVDAACWKTWSELFAQHDFPIVLPHRTTPWRYGEDCRTLGFAELDESADSVPPGGVQSNGYTLQPTASSLSDCRPRLLARGCREGCLSS